MSRRLVRLSNATSSQVGDVTHHELIVGRVGGEATLPIPGDTKLSRRHGKIWAEDGHVWYLDLGSHNGSWMDGQRLQARVCLRPGKIVHLGETRLQLDVEVNAPPKWDGTLPPGLHLRLESPVDGQALADSLDPTDCGAGLYVSSLYRLLQKMIDTGTEVFLTAALQQIEATVPAAQRISIVGWPPSADATWIPLMASVVAPSISSSLAHYAVLSQHALWLSDTQPQGVTVGPSVEKLGIVNAVYVPLSTADLGTMGLLCVDSRTAGLSLTPQHFHFICAVGSLLASSLAAEHLRERNRQEHAQAVQEAAHRQSMLTFLQIASHDLKNPLTAILGCAQLLEAVSEPAQQAELIGLIYHAGKRAQNLIQAYLDASQAESGRPLEVSWSLVDPARLVMEEVDFLRRAMADSLQGLTLLNHIDCGPLAGDDHKLRQIMANLLSNAIKYSPPGGHIVIRSENEGERTRLFVSDQGVGISSADQEKLFTPFQRVGDTHWAPGTGLGLWLAAVLVAAQGGQLEVDSTLGTGSTFSFTLPRTVPSELQEPLVGRT